MITVVLAKHSGSNKKYTFRVPDGHCIHGGTRIIVDTMRGMKEAVACCNSIWREEHPQKTYKQDFLEKFPNAQVYDSGEPLASACNVYGKDIRRN